jgi:hypothetical protein
VGWKSGAALPLQGDCGGAAGPVNLPNGILNGQSERSLTVQIKTGPSKRMSLNDLEFAYAPVRDQVRDLREYL